MDHHWRRTDGTGPELTTPTNKKPPQNNKTIQLADFLTFRLFDCSTVILFDFPIFFLIFAAQTQTGLIWIRQQVEWECKHVERCEAGSLIPTTSPINGNNYDYALAA